MSRLTLRTEGGVEFENVTMKYRSDLEPVLREVTFSVKPGEKIGIVGRTGAGKSTVSLALFHMILHSAGSIKIDGVDIFKIGLDDLRTHLAVIPQDPVMFVGTMRHNLDPHGTYPDEELWEALERVNLKPFVASQPLKLEMDITENGENLSVGQRQLVCIARCAYLYLLRVLCICVRERTCNLRACAYVLVCVVWLVCALCD